MGRGINFEVLSLFIIFFMEIICMKFGAGHVEVQKCDGHGPDIRFPFGLKDSQLDQGGYPGFALSCTKQKETIIELPLDVKLYVREIDYVSQLIDVYFDPHDCIASMLRNLNLSASPFQYNDRDLYNFSLFICPSPEARECYDYFLTPACLNHSVNNLYALYSELGCVLSCTKTGSILAVPDNIFVSTPTNGIRLNWSTPACGKCEARGNRCGPKINGTEDETQCFAIPNRHKARTVIRLKVAAGGVLGSIVGVSIALGLYRAYRIDRREKENEAKIEKFLEDYRALKPTRYSYADIKRITNQFRDKLGEGGYGTVFKGKLSNEIFVAVKILNITDGNGEEFLNEVGTMGKIHHVNVVRLVGFCADGFRRALVYEFMPKESLEKFIFSEEIKKSLGWVKLRDVALGIAKGIEYLHQGCDQRILHFDIKPHNILLDANFNPKVSDFGLAKLCSKEKSVVSMTAARGTVGYIAPEVFSRNFGSVSHKSDVYSFGMLLFDMVRGRKSRDVTVEGGSQAYFPEWIYKHLEEGESVGIGINGEGDADIAKQLTIVGLRCIQWYPGDRPSMKEVVQMLEGEGDNLTMPPNPFASTNNLMKPGTLPKLGRSFNIELEIISESE